jgi:hypothetical protein
MGMDSKCWQDPSVAVNIFFHFPNNFSLISFGTFFRNKNSLHHGYCLFFFFSVQVTVFISGKKKKSKTTLINSFLGKRS